MKKTVMILGAANGQLPFIEICKNKGYRVIAVSPEGDYPGFKVADQCCYMDTCDKDRILEVAAREKIDAILSDQTDVSIPSVAYVSERLGLMSIGYEKALPFSNKYRMRQKAREIGIPVPNFFEAGTLESAEAGLRELTWPIIMKPVDASGSRGVVKIHTADDLRRHFHTSLSYSKTESVILEEFIEGEEFIADGLALNGKYINTDLGLKEYFSIPGRFISKMCMFHSAAAITQKRELDVLETNKKLVEGLELSFGITHGEYIVSRADNKVYLVEIAARGGGVYLSSHLTPKACGVNVNEVLIDYVVEGISVDIEQLRLAQNAAAFVCFALEQGTVSEMINKDELYKTDGVFKVCLDDLAVGKRVDALTDDSNKYGPILVEAESREGCYNVIERVKNIFDVIVTKDTGEKSHIIW